MKALDFLQMLPSILAISAFAAKQVEESVASGSVKKEAALTIVKASVEVADSLKVKLPADAIVTASSSILDATVAAFNLVGIFRKKSS